VRAVFAFCKKSRLDSKLAFSRTQLKRSSFMASCTRLAKCSELTPYTAPASIGRSRTFDLAMEQQFVASVIAVKETRHNIDNAGIITVAVDTLASSKLPKEQKIKLAGRVSLVDDRVQRSDVACSLAVRRSQVVTIHETATC